MKNKITTILLIASLAIGSLGTINTVSVSASDKYGDDYEFDSYLPYSMPDYGEHKVSGIYYPEEYGKYTGNRLYFTPYDFVGDYNILWEEFDEYDDNSNKKLNIMYDESSGWNTGKNARHIILKKGQSLELGTNYDNVEGSNVVYSSTDDSIVSFVNGKLKANKKGEAVVSACVTGETILSQVPADLQRFFTIKMTVTVRDKGKKITQGKYLSKETKDLYKEWTEGKCKGNLKNGNYYNDDKVLNYKKGYNLVELVCKNWLGGVITTKEAKKMLNRITIWQKKTDYVSDHENCKNTYFTSTLKDSLKIFKFKKFDAIKMTLKIWKANAVIGAYGDIKVNYDKKTKYYYVYAMQIGGGMDELASEFISKFGRTIEDKKIKDINFFRNDDGSVPEDFWKRTTPISPVKY